MRPEFSNLGIKAIPISEDYPTKFDRLLCGGIWCIVQLNMIYGRRRKMPPIPIRKLTPIQMPHVDIEELKGRQKELHRRRVDQDSCCAPSVMEPDKLNDRERWLLLAVCCRLSRTTSTSVS